LVPLKIEANVPAGEVPIKANVSWLECDVQCIPGQAAVQTTLKLGPESKASENASLLLAWEK
jgi:DsbC/DsbD-like thiol-disulfide interchange protein